MRHGAHTRPDCLIGQWKWEADPWLTATAPSDTKKVVDALIPVFGEKPLVVVSGTWRRHRETSELLITTLAHWEKSIIRDYDQRRNERRFGYYRHAWEKYPLEGSSREQVAYTLGVEPKYLHTHPAFTFEASNQIIHRAFQAFENMVWTYGPQSTILIISSGGTIRTLLSSMGYSHNEPFANRETAQIDYTLTDSGDIEIDAITRQKYLSPYHQDSHHGG